jgi:hypothetical protein
MALDAVKERRKAILNENRSAIIQVEFYAYKDDGSTVIAKETYLY